MKTEKKTNVTMRALLIMMLCLAVCMGMSACKEQPAINDAEPQTTTVVADEYDVLWNDARYTEDTVIGEGATTFELEVICGKNSVTFTVNTDETNLGTALQSAGLVEGDNGEYGLYVKKVNGVTADYDANMCYWSFTKNGEMMMTGIDGEEIEAGAHYEMTVAK